MTCSGVTCRPHFVQDAHSEHTLAEPLSDHRCRVDRFLHWHYGFFRINHSFRRALAFLGSVRVRYGLLPPLQRELPIV